MEKRGMLLAEETLKIIVALIGITFLVIFLTSLYFSNLSEQKLQQAKQELTGSKESIKSLVEEIGEGQSRNKNLVSPVGWSLIFFDAEKPNSCIGETCACICDSVSFGSQVDECSESGACLDVENLVYFEDIEIKNPNEEIVNLTVKKIGGRIIFSTSVGSKTSENKEETETTTDLSKANPSNLKAEEISFAQKYVLQPVNWLTDGLRNGWGWVRNKIARPRFLDETPTSVAGVKAGCTDEDGCILEDNNPNKSIA